MIFNDKMIKYFNKGAQQQMGKRWISFILLLTILLVSCNQETEEVDKVEEINLSSEDILEKVMKTQDERSSFTVDFREDDQHSKENGIILSDIEADKYMISYNHIDEDYYLTKDDFIVDDDFIAISLSRYDEVAETYESLIQKITFPLHYFQEEDDDFISYFHVEEDEDTYVLTFDDQGEYNDRLRDTLINIDLFELEEEGKAIDVANVQLKVKDFSIVTDVETDLLKTFEFNITLVSDEFPEDKKFYGKYEFSDYDSIDPIELPSTDEDLGSLMDFEKDEAEESIKDEDIETVEKEAKAYVDALIQATIYQDVDQFIERAPGSMSDEDKTSEGEIQQTMFKEILQENLALNLGQIGISDEQIEKLTKGYIESIATAEYEMIGAKVDGDEIIVTLEISGINESAIYDEAELKALENIDENMTEEEFANEFIDQLIKSFANIDSLEDPVEKEVTVIQMSGSYHVLLQDEYIIGGFAH